MPGLNQKGPEGAGAMTGRQSGMCRRTENQSFGSDSGNGSGRGRGMGTRCGQGQGQGLGQGRRLDSGTEQPQRAGVANSDELKNLKEQYQAAQKVLSTIEEKIIAALGNGK
ncbi:MAG: hypothetical protein GQ542_10505 [Desulforhopalus sp.]|nr:hypothetical protein [Desulforhopalus sp.]